LGGPGTYSNVGGTLTLSLGSLAAGTASNVVIIAKGAARGVYNNAISVAADQADLHPSDNTAQDTIAIFNTVPAQLSASPASGGGPFVLTLTGAPGQAYVIQASTDLTSWAPVYTNTTSVGGTFQFADPNNVSSPYKFYRALLGP